MPSRLLAAGLGALMALLAFLLTAAPVTAQIVQGTVSDNASKTPIPTVEVVLVDAKGESSGRAVSDSLGEFRIQAPEPGRYALLVQRIGYATQTTTEFELERAEVVVVEVSMSIEALQMEPLVIVERRMQRYPMLERFHERAEWTRRTGLGRVYFREDLRGMGSVHNLYMMQLGNRSCQTTILVDNLPVEDPRDLDFLADIERVEGIEIYRRELQIPMEYSHLRACALMLVWSSPVSGNPLSLKRFLIGGALAVTLFLINRR